MTAGASVATASGRRVVRSRAVVFGLVVGEEYRDTVCLVRLGGNR
jgi:hypothetical protein